MGVTMVGGIVILHFAFEGRHFFCRFVYMDKVLKIVSIKDRQSDFEYWITKTPAERLEAIEFLRIQYQSLIKNVHPGFQRVCRVVNQKQG